jgi:hypothetical protein
MTATVRRSSRVRASADDVWSVLARFGDLARWAPDVEHACLLHDDDLAVGLVRRVQVGRAALLETVDELEAGRRLGYRITGLPPVLREVRNAWSVEADGTDTLVSITTTVDAGPRPPQQLIARLVARRLARTSDSMLAGLATHLTSEDRTNAHGAEPTGEATHEHGALPRRSRNPTT